jgi:WD40 repeat protein
MEKNKPTYIRLPKIEVRMFFLIAFIFLLINNMHAAHELVAQPATQSVQKTNLLDGVTSVLGVQSLIRDYLAQDWILVREMRAHNIESLVSSPDGKYSAYTMWRRRGGDVKLGQGSTKNVENNNLQVMLCDLMNNKMHEINTPWSMGVSVHLGFSHDGKYLALAQQDGFYIIDSENQKSVIMDPDKPFSHALQTKQKVEMRADVQLQYLAFSPHNNYFAVLYSDSILSIWDLTDIQKPKFVKDIKLENFDDIMCDKILFTQNNQQIIILSEYCEYYHILDIASGKLKNVNLETPVNPLTACVLNKQHDKFIFPDNVNPRGCNLCTCEFGSTTYSQVPFHIKKTPAAIAVISDKYIAVAFNNMGIYIYDISNRDTIENEKKYILELPIEGEITNLSCSSDGVYLTAQINIPRKDENEAYTVIKHWINMAVYLKKA